MPPLLSPREQSLLSAKFRLFLFGRREQLNVSPVQHTPNAEVVWSWALPCPGSGQGLAVLFPCLWALLADPESIGSPGLFPPSPCCLLLMWGRTSASYYIVLGCSFGGRNPDLRCPSSLSCGPLQSCRLANSHVLRLCWGHCCRGFWHQRTTMLCSLGWAVSASVDFVCDC